MAAGLTAAGLTVGLIAAPTAAAASATTVPQAVSTTAEAPITVYARSGSNNIKGGWRMGNNQSVYSPDGKTRLTLLRGLLEVWVDGQHRWTANQSSAGHYVTFQNDGNLVVYRDNGGAVWSSRTSIACSGWAGCHLAIENTGNVAVENSLDYYNYWESNTER
ncbi:hypothetical protein ABZ863_12735 [Saccharomonospora sp. NPDC046836]|uniref:hypothetical protein n=1 Tax=Saccharomonospora sp. NPDC046836 TaxID=3156921 RepID=UPI003405B7CF